MVEFNTNWGGVEGIAVWKDLERCMYFKGCKFTYCYSRCLVKSVIPR